MIRTFKPRWDRFGVMKDTIAVRELGSSRERASVDEFHFQVANTTRDSYLSYLSLARVILFVPVALMFAVEWVVSMVVRAIAALVNRRN